MSDSADHDAPVMSVRRVLDSHVEDLDSPGSCSCGWELWDGTLDECRAAYRAHVAAYLRENNRRMSALVKSIFPSAEGDPA